MKQAALAAVLTTATLGLVGQAQAETLFIDLTHPIPTFEALEGDPMKPDLGKPIMGSVPVPTFGQQVIRWTFPFPTNQGYFELGNLLLPEHHGTHMDASAHYVNNDETMEPGNTPPAERLRLHQLDGDDLSGRIVLIDISERVQAELDKNGGKPSPDTAVTDFSNDSGNVVTAADIEAVADKIDDGVWIVLHQGWSRFFFEGADWNEDPFINAWNYPGLAPEAVDKIIEIEDQKGVTIGGIMSDVIGVETGENSHGEDDKWTNSWRAHVRGLQRGWKIVENGTNLGQLAMLDSDRCTLVVGVIKQISGAGGPARVFAACEQ